MDKHVRPCSKHHWLAVDSSSPSRGREREGGREGDDGAIYSALISKGREKCSVEKAAQDLVAVLCAIRALLEDNAFNPPPHQLFRVTGGGASLKKSRLCWFLLAFFRGCARVYGLQLLSNDNTPTSTNTHTPSSERYPVLVSCSIPLRRSPISRVSTINRHANLLPSSVPVTPLLILHPFLSLSLSIQI